MIVRHADLDSDALAIDDGARDFVRRVAFRRLMPDDDALTGAVARILTLDGVEILVADDDGTIVGGIGLLFAPYLWNPGVLTADELFWWAAPDAPYRAAHKLFRAAMARIEERGAEPLFRALTTSPEGVDRMYRRAGLVPIEIVYARD